MGDAIDYMYNWIREKSGKQIKEKNMCPKHETPLNEDGTCTKCLEENNK